MATPPPRTNCWHASADADSDRNDGILGRDYIAENIALPHLLERLLAGRDALSVLADLTDAQLDAVPSAGSFRFCGGERTLEQVVFGLLKHQHQHHHHQIDAIKSALT